MKKYAFLMTSALTASLLLAACGTNEDATSTDKQAVTPETTATQQETATVASPEPETETEVTETTPTENTEGATTPTVETNVDQTAPEAIEQPVTQLEEQTEEQTTAVASEKTEPAQPAATPSQYTASPEQNYEIQLQDGLTLTAEEPGRDMVMTEQSDASMRIEVFAKSEISFDEAAQLAKETIEVTAPEGQYEAFDTAPFQQKNADVLNAVGYKIVYQEDAEQTVTIVLEKADKIVQLTVFDTTAQASTNQLLESGFTAR